MKNLILCLLTCGAVFAADAPEMRSQAEKLENAGNWKEAYELRVKLLREVDDKDSGKDLEKALVSQNQLGDQKSFDPLLDELTVSKKGNLPLSMLAVC
jgi:hypothetical protein